MEQGGGQRLTEQPSIPHRAQNLVAAGWTHKPSQEVSEVGHCQGRAGYSKGARRENCLTSERGDSCLRGCLVEEMSRELRGKG